MANYRNITIGILLFIGSAQPTICNAQGWDCMSSFCRSMQSQWSININAGTTSYFGDLSIYDTRPVKKIQHEGGPGFGIIGTRYFNKPFGISLQLITGRMKASHRNISFRSNFFEYNFHGRVKLMRLINKNYSGRIGWDVYAGIGQFIYQTKQLVKDNADGNSTWHQTQIPEFVYFFGSGLNYPLSPCISLSIDLSLKQSHTDRLDDYIGSDDFDYYTYLSVGLSYNF